MVLIHCSTGMVDMDTLVIGRFVKPFGVKGYIRFQLYSHETSHLVDVKHVDVSVLQRRLHVEKWLLTAPLRCKIEGIDTPEHTKDIIGFDVSVTRELATPLQSEEYYLKDLCGLGVCTSRGVVLGTIAGVISDAYAPLFEVKWNKGKKTYIPFIKEFFALPDLDKRIIFLLNEDLIES